MSRASFLARNQGFSTDLDDRLEKYYNLFCTVDGFETKILWSKEYNSLFVWLVADSWCEKSAVGWLLVAGLF
jgi:hypothetical protein